MRVITGVALISLAMPCSAAAQGRIPSDCVALAMGPERLRPAAFGDALPGDSVRLRFIDHASFLIETAGGLTAVTDYTGFTGSADLVPDVVTMNNAHSTHWTPVPDPRIPHVLQGWAEAGRAADHHLDLGEMLVRNVPTDTRGPDGDARADGNSVFVFEVAGLCIGHLGHLHHVPTPEDIAMIGRLDVVMVPVDGGYTLPVETMAEVVRRFRSSVVVPMHWFSGASLERFLAEIAGSFDVVEVGGAEIVLSLDRLPRRPTVMVLRPDLLND
jgi:L-ascorbate metabolism protein UlaG (beta-lactamase superfamily)